VSYAAKGPYVVFGRRADPVGVASTLLEAKEIARTDARMMLRWKKQEVDGRVTYYSDGDYWIEVGQIPS
jgi:hypothetical protein